MEECLANFFANFLISKSYSLNTVFILLSLSDKKLAIKLVKCQDLDCELPNNSFEMPKQFSIFFHTGKMKNHSSEVA